MLCASMCPNTSMCAGLRMPSVKQRLYRWCSLRMRCAGQTLQSRHTCAEVAPDGACTALDTSPLDSSRRRARGHPASPAITATVYDALYSWLVPAGVVASSGGH